MKKNLISTMLFSLLLFSCNKKEAKVTPSINLAQENKLIKSTLTLTGEVKILCDLAKKYERSDPDNALFYAEKLLTLSKEEKDILGQVRAYYILGYAYEGKCLYMMSLVNVFNCIELAKDINSTIDIANSYKLIGIIHSKVGLLEKAILNYEKAIEQFKLLGDQKNSAQLYYGIAITYRENKQYKEAEEHFIKSAGIQKELGNQEDLAHAYNSLGNLFKETGAYEKALSYLSQSLAISESMNHAELRALALHNTGYVLYQQKKYTEAKEYYTKALAQSEKVSGFPELLICIHRDMGLNELALKEVEKAIPYLEKGEAIAQGSKQAKLEIEVTGILAECYNKLGNTNKALYYSEKSRSIQVQDLAKEVEELDQAYQKRDAIDDFGDKNSFGSGQQPISGWTIGFYMLIGGVIMLVLAGVGIWVSYVRVEKKLLYMVPPKKGVIEEVLNGTGGKYSDQMRKQAEAIYQKMHQIQEFELAKKNVPKKYLHSLYYLVQKAKWLESLAESNKKS